jgi:general stress protein 26
MLDQARLRRAVDKAFVKKSFMTLATSSSADRSHAAAVLYVAIDGVLYIGTNMNSRKARNIESNANVGVCIPVRRLPIGPPATIMFQGTAEALDRDDHAFRSLLDSGRLKPLTAHGELDDPDNWFIRITPTGKVHTFGLGVPLLTFVRHPLETMGTVQLS